MLTEAAEPTSTIMVTALAEASSITSARVARQDPLKAGPDDECQQHCTEPVAVTLVEEWCPAADHASNLSDTNDFIGTPAENI